jgi:hypothetical protein
MKQFQQKSQKQSRTLLFISTLIIILLGFNTFTTYNSVQTIKQNKLDDEWNFISSIIIENQDKATIQGNYLKEGIVKDIKNTYIDKDKLKYDLKNFDVNSQLSIIFNNNLQGKYINMDNDNNDLFLIDTFTKSPDIDLTGRILYDKSVNCSSKGEMRDLARELSMHYNYNLGYDAFKKTLQHNDEKPIFIEYLRSDNPNHINLDSASLDGLKEVYVKEGLSGLSTYEILTPIYIDDKSDILGQDVVQNNGVLNKDSLQLVLIQGFSIKDAMQKHTQSLLLEDKNYDMQIRNTELYSIFGNILMLIVFFSILKVQNLVIELEELEDNIKNEI